VATRRDYAIESKGLPIMGGANIREHGGANSA
jgi:hypothetical protein